MIERFVELRMRLKRSICKSQEMPTADELVTLKQILNLLKPLVFMAQECMTDYENYIMVSKIILIEPAMTEYQNARQMMELSVKLKKIRNWKSCSAKQSLSIRFLSSPYLIPSSNCTLSFEMRRFWSTGLMPHTYCAT